MGGGKVITGNRNKFFWRCLDVTKRRSMGVIVGVVCRVKEGFRKVRGTIGRKKLKK